MTVDEMKDTLSRLNIEVVNERGDEIQAFCVAHEERTGHVDHNPSFWINADSGAFICFSCQWKGNLYTLVSYVEGIDIEQAQSWVGTDSNMMARFQRVTGTHKEAPRVEEPVVITESMLKAFVPVPEFALKSRGLTAESATKYGILWNKLENNWVIPIREPLSAGLIGWQEKGYDRRFFKNMSRVKKSEALFGYDVYKGGTMVVVESPLDVVRLESVGITGGVAIMGASVSETQFKILGSADRIIFALDNDDAGRSASREMLKWCLDTNVEAWFFNYDNTDMKDVGAMSKDEIEWGIKHARHIVRGAKAI